MHLHLNVVDVPTDLQKFIRVGSFDPAEVGGVWANSYYTKQGIALDASQCQVHSAAVKPIVMEIYEASMTSGTTAAE